MTTSAPLGLNSRAQELELKCQRYKALLPDANASKILRTRNKLFEPHAERARKLADAAALVRHVTPVKLDVSDALDALESFGVEKWASAGAKTNSLDKKLKAVLDVVEAELLLSWRGWVASGLPPQLEKLLSELPSYKELAGKMKDARAGLDACSASLPQSQATLEHVQTLRGQISGLNEDVEKTGLSTAARDMLRRAASPDGVPLKTILNSEELSAWLRANPAVLGALSVRLTKESVR
jgi:hypothetical protein